MWLIWQTYTSERVVVVCCSRPSCGGCNWVTWHYLHSLSWTIRQNHQIQRRGTWKTHWHHSERLESAMWHRRLSANSSAVCRRQTYTHCCWLCLASVVRRRRRKLLAATVTVGQVQTTSTVSDVITTVDDVTLPQSTETVRRSRRWTETCWSAEWHDTTSRRGITDRNIHRQSPQRTTEAVSGQWNQHWRSSAASVQRFTFTTTRRSSTHRCWLTKKHICSGLWQWLYSAVKL